jgi:hypothetical protein
VKSVRFGEPCRVNGDSNVEPLASKLVEYCLELRAREHIKCCGKDGWTMLLATTGQPKRLYAASSIIVVLDRRCNSKAQPRLVARVYYDHLYKRTYMLRSAKSGGKWVVFVEHLFLACNLPSATATNFSAAPGSDVLSGWYINASLR